MPIEYGDGSDSNAGRVVQVVYGIKDDTSSISVSGSGSGNLWSGPSITMSDSNNKVLILGSITLGLSSEQRADIILYRGSSALALGNSSGSRFRATGATNSYVCYYAADASISHLDSPGSGTHQYKIYGHQGAGGGGRTIYMNRTGCDSNNGEYSRYSSSLVLMEIAYS
tara:strand:- start:554 stop:1060 length:507 start_codon:yes stop_codon:yes gene_type:complete